MDCIVEAITRDTLSGIESRRLKAQDRSPITWGEVHAEADAWLERVGLDGWRVATSDRPLHDLTDTTPGGRGLTFDEAAGFFGALVAQAMKQQQDGDQPPAAAEGWFVDE